MACARPVVCSRAGGLAFTVEPGVTGYQAEVGDDSAFATALQLLLEDRDLRLAMGRAGEEAASRFGWPAVASAMLHVYQRLADGYRENFCCLEEIYA
jgi:glycosyltransferase involved in cell wall biosynthesis